MVRGHHRVTDEWFDLQSAPFATVSAAKRLDDGRLLVVEAGGMRAAYGTPARTKPYHPLNWAIIALYLAVMAAMGLWFMHRNKSSDDYFRGGGRLPWWVVSMSIYATMFSSITFLSIPALTYLTDCRYLVISFGVILLAPVVTKWYLPFFRRLNLTSAYEYLEVRFNLPCRLFASAAFTVFMVARTAIVTYLPAIAVAAVSALVMAGFVYLAEKEQKAWVESFSVAGSMIVGMAAAVVIGLLVK